MARTGATCATRSSRSAWPMERVHEHGRRRGAAARSAASLPIVPALAMWVCRMSGLTLRSVARHSQKRSSVVGSELPAQAPHEPRTHAKFSRQVVHRALARALDTPDQRRLVAERLQKTGQRQGLDGRPPDVQPADYPDDTCHDRILSNLAARASP